MVRAVHHLSVIRSFRDGRPLDVVQVMSPAWTEVEYAIRRMDNDCLPLAQLNPTADEEDENIFNVIGGAGRWALFQMMGKWRYEDPSGGLGEVRLWETGQAYRCQERHVLTEVEAVLAIVRTFYQTGEYEGL